MHIVQIIFHVINKNVEFDAYILNIKKEGKIRRRDNFKYLFTFPLKFLYMLHVLLLSIAPQYDFSAVNKANTSSITPTEIAT